MQWYDSKLKCGGNYDQMFGERKSDICHLYKVTLYREVRHEGENRTEYQEGAAGQDDGEDRRGRREAGGRQEGGRAPTEVIQRVHEEPGGQIQHRDLRVSDTPDQCNKTFFTPHFSDPAE